MRLLLKTFIRKQVRPLIVLTLLSLMVLVSMQITMTVWSKHQTLVQRVDQINGAHMHVYLNLERRENQLLDLIDVYSKQHQVKLSVETTKIFPYNDGNRPYDIMFEGYGSDSDTNYQVIQGKPLNQLVGNQVAISESYARMLRLKGIDPLSHIITYDQIIPNTLVSFEVVSIIDYPNFNDAFVFDQTLKDIPLFDFPFVSVGLAPKETIEYWSQQSLLTGTLYNQKLVQKITFDQYSRRGEEQLLTFILNAFRLNSYDEKLLPLYEISDYLSTNEQLYQFLSLLFLGGFLLATTYTFITYVQRQLVTSAKDIGLLMIIGINQVSLKKVLLLRLGIILGLSVMLFGLINGIYIWQIGTNRVFTSLFDVNKTIISFTLIAAAVYFLWLILLYQIQMRRYITHSFASLKTKGKKFIKNPTVSQQWMPLVVAIKSLMAHVSFAFSSIITMAVLIFLLFVSYFANQHIQTMYNKETLGIQFDYLVVDAVFADFAFTQEFAQAQMMMEKHSNFYFVDIDYSEYYRSYYKSNFLMFLADMAPFVPIVEGTTPPDLRRSFFEQKAAFRYVAASRKHMDTTNGFVYTEENLIRTKQPERGYLFYLVPGDLEPSRETAANIYGTVNTLIDQGWIAFVYRDRQMIDIGFPTVEMYVFNVKDDVDTDLLESQLAQRGVTTYRYDDILEMMNIANQQSNREILGLMSAIGIGLLVILIINILAFNMMITLENKEDEKLCYQMGVSLHNVNKIKINRFLIMLLLASIFAYLLLLVGYPLILDQILKAHGLYYTIALPSIYTTIFPLYLLALLIIFSLVNMISIKKKEA